MNFKVSLFSVFKKVVSKYSRVTQETKKKIEIARRSTISEGNLNGIFKHIKSKKTSLMNPSFLLEYQKSLQTPLNEESQ